MTSLEHPINFYADYIKQRYGGRIQKISIEAGFTCPNRDGTVATGGCSYCNNESFSPLINQKLTIQEQVAENIKRQKRRYKKVDKFIAYFQSYSNTYAPLEQLKELYLAALQHPQVIGLAIGTRPDCIDREKLLYLKELSEQYDVTIEYGLESMSDHTLRQINRGHDFNCYQEAVELTAQLGIKQCTHLIIGLPGEDQDHWVRTAQKLSTLPIDFLKIHQLHIVKGTTLGAQYRQAPWPLLTEEEYLEVLVNFLEHLDGRIIIQRMFGEAPRDLVLSPHWNTPLSQLREKLLNKMRQAKTYQGRLAV
jgi:radical SAM protein (TIGR01212 family)